MKDTKEFIEEIIPQMDSPKKVYKLFHGLGYKTLDPSFRGKESWELREKDKEIFHSTLRRKLSIHFLSSPQITKIISLFW